MRRDVLIFGCDAPYGTAIARRLTSDGWRVAGIVHRESAYANDFPVLALEPLDSADLATAIEQRLPDFRPQGMVVIPRWVGPTYDALAECWEHGLDVAFTAGAKLGAARLVGGQWTMIGDALAEAATEPSVGVGVDGALYVGWTDGSAGRAVVRVMRLPR